MDEEPVEQGMAALQLGAEWTLLPSEVAAAIENAALSRLRLAVPLPLEQGPWMPEGMP